MAKFKEWLTVEGLIKISGWARDGLSDEQIAGNIGIATSTFYDWKTRYAEFSEAIRVNKEIADRSVENALYKNANGYDYTEEVAATQKEVIYKDGKREREIVTPVALQLKRHKPAETTAIMYWLNNRKPADWKNRRDGVEPSKGDQSDGKSDKLALLSGFAKRN